MILLTMISLTHNYTTDQTIFEAAKRGDVAALKAILEADSGLVNAPGEAGRSALQKAILAGQSEFKAFIAPLDISFVIE